MKSEIIVHRRTEKNIVNRRLSSLDRLAKEQKVKVLKTTEDVEKLFALWPGKEDAEEFYNFVRKDRDERRTAENENQ